MSKVIVTFKKKNRAYRVTKVQNTVDFVIGEWYNLKSIGENIKNYPHVTFVITE